MWAKGRSSRSHGWFVSGPDVWVPFDMPTALHASLDLEMVDFVCDAVIMPEFMPSLLLESSLVPSKPQIVPKSLLVSLNSRGNIRTILESSTWVRSLFTRLERENGDPAHLLLQSHHLESFKVCQILSPILLFPLFGPG